MSDDQQSRPPGWEMAELGDVVSSVTYSHTASATEQEVGPRFLRITDLQDGIVDWPSVPYCECTPAEQQRYRLKPGDIVVARTGATTGKSFLLGNIPSATVFASYLIRLETLTDVDSQYLRSFMQGPGYWEQITNVKQGMAQPGVNASVLKELEVPIPPLPEQHRIVSKIEALQERSGRAAKALAEVGPLLEQFRQSILAAAFSGRLTADWREKRRTFVEDEHRRMDIPVRLLSSHDPSNHEEISDKNVQATRGEENEVSDRNVQATNTKDETAAELLARIRTERRRRWEHAELAKYKAKGKQPPKDWKKKYEEPEPVDETDLPQLPEGWSWSSVDTVASKISDGVHRKPNYVDSGIPFITVKNLTCGPGISFEDTKFISVEDHLEFVKRTHPVRGDVLVTKDGATLGRVRLIETDEVFSIFVSVALIKLIEPTIAPFLVLMLESPQGQEAMKVTGTGIQHIHLVDLRATIVPVPPFAEQEAICRLVHACLAAVRQLNNNLVNASTCLTQLNQSILAKAFRGELVPQDFGDEPASELLARIREQRNNSGKNAQGTNSGKNAQGTNSGRNAQGTKKGQRRMDIPVRRSSHE